MDVLSSIHSNNGGINKGLFLLRGEATFFALQEIRRTGKFFAQCSAVHRDEV